MPAYFLKTLYNETALMESQICFSGQQLSKLKAMAAAYKAIFYSSQRGFFFFFLHLAPEDNISNLAAAAARK